MTAEVLLDSVILIDHLNGVAEGADLLRRLRDTAVISVITRAEVLAGARPEEAPVVARLLDGFPTLALDAPLADRAAALRHEHGWKLPDAIQAAFALRDGLWLATRDTRDFPPSRHGFVWVPYEV